MSYKRKNEEKKNKKKKKKNGNRINIRGKNDGRIANEGKKERKYRGRRRKRIVM